MEDSTAIIITQIPVAIAILIIAYEVRLARKALMRLLETIVKKLK